MEDDSDDDSLGWDTPDDVFADPEELAEQVAAAVAAIRTRAARMWVQLHSPEEG